MKFEALPPVIVATDFPDPSDALCMARQLSSLDTADVGIKISNGNAVIAYKEIMPRLREQDPERFVIVDTRFSDGADQLVNDIGSLLIAADQGTPLPDAITMKAVMYGDADHLETIKRDVLTPLADRGVAVIAFSDPVGGTVVEDGDILAGVSIKRHAAAKSIGFDACEIPAQAVSHFFYEEPHYNARECSVKLIASKFIARRIIEEGLNAVTSEAYEQGISSIYLGRAVTKSDDPLGVVSEVLEARLSIIQTAGGNSTE